MGGHKPFALAGHEGLVCEPGGTTDQTLNDLRSQPAAEIVVGRTSVPRYLDALGLTLKKTTLHAAEQDRPDVVAARSHRRLLQRRRHPAVALLSAPMRQLRLASA